MQPIVTAFDLAGTLKEGFMTTPLDNYIGSTAPALSEKDLAGLVDFLNVFSKTDFKSFETEGRNFIYWLTYALHRAMELEQHKEVSICTSIMYHVADKYSEQVISLLDKVIEAGPYKGQTLAYRWCDELYTANYDESFDYLIVSINLIFSTLLKSTDKSLPLILVRKNEGIDDMGRSPWLVLMLSLLSMADKFDEQRITTMIATFLAQCVQRSPEVLGLALTEDMTVGTFQGKNTIYLLAAQLQAMCTNNPSAFTALIDILEKVHHVYPELLMTSLRKTVNLGPFKGLNSLQIILISLVSAAYINKNTQVVNDIVRILNQLMLTDEAMLSSVLIEPINDGEHAGENGVMMLVRALVTAADHQLDIEPLANLLIKLLKNSDEKFSAAFTWANPLSRIKDYTVMPVLKLINGFSSNHPDNVRYYFSNVIEELALASSIKQIESLLPAEALTVFHDHLANAQQKKSHHVSSAVSSSSSLRGNQCFFKCGNKDLKVDEKLNDPDEAARRKIYPESN